MSKICGNGAEFALVKQERSRTIIGYELRRLEGSSLSEWHEVYFPRKVVDLPSIEQVREAVEADINAQVKSQIIGGFVWNGKPVWLSEENQMNFALAVVPVTLKIGEQADGSPIYETFTTASDMKAFSDACTQWKQQQLSAGWDRKDAFDWQAYQQALDALTPPT